MSNKMETPQQVFVGRNALFFVIICLLFLRVNDLTCIFSFATNTALPSSS